MASRELRDLNDSTRVKHDKFMDKCRRDLELLKHGISVILTCTNRSKDEQNKLAGLGLGDRSCPCMHNGSAFDVAVLRYGKVIPCEGEFWNTIVKHAETVGLTKGCEGFYGN